mmetsp:Transcript_41740/g.98127  ORF Transcript_41740/g.98127 Transcript_41740/m.98127 type:complete len:246 (+) Transcript_41740:1-738(+)
MNTVLHQEIHKYNRLISVVHSSLRHLRRALDGLEVMSTELEEASSALSTGRLPRGWADVSYPTTKPLAPWMDDLRNRVSFIANWAAANATPHIFWLSGFYFPHGFLTAAMQNYARKYSVAVDGLVFDFRFLGEEVPAGPPDDGVYVEGIYLQAGRWCHETKQLQEEEPKELYSPLPIIWFLPTRVGLVEEFPHYLAPVYRTTTRAGILSTTGKSTNFVLPIKIPSTVSSEFWVMRGTACLLSLDD